jgi:hypothetical protein
MTVRLHIERLVVDGLPYQRADMAGLQEALEAALGARLAEAGAGDWTSAAIASLRLGTIGLRAADGPGEIGESIGRSLSHALRPHRQGGPGKAAEPDGARFRRSVAPYPEFSLGGATK